MEHQNADVTREAGQKKAAEPKAGVGSRNLHQWQKISAAREELASSDQARAQFSADPSLYFQQFGVEVGALDATRSGGELSELEKQISAANPFQQEFGDIRGCMSAVLGPVAVVVAGVGAAVGAAVGAVAANVAAAANAVGAANANWAWNTNWVTGCDL